MYLLGDRRASKAFHSYSALAREEQVNCTSDTAGAFLGCLSDEMTTDNYVRATGSLSSITPG